VINSPNSNFGPAGSVFVLFYMYDAGSIIWSEVNCPDRFPCAEVLIYIGSFILVKNSNTWSSRWHTIVSL